MLVLVEHLMNIEQVLTDGGCIFDNTDGCAKQYRCATALYLLSVLCASKNVSIDRAIGAPGHGKDLVDGINAVNKQYLKN